MSETKRMSIILKPYFKRTSIVFIESTKKIVHDTLIYFFFVKSKFRFNKK